MCTCILVCVSQVIHVSEFVQFDVVIVSLFVLQFVQVSNVNMYQSNVHMHISNNVHVAEFLHMDVSDDAHVFDCVYMHLILNTRLCLYLYLSLYKYLNLYIYLVCT